MNITVDTSSPIPPYEQLRAAIAGLIAVGALEPGAPLPSVRQLATDLDLAPGTVQRAYSELQAAGRIRSRARRGAVVADHGPPAEVGEHMRGQVAGAAGQFVERARRLGLSNDEIRRALEAQLAG